MLKQFLSTTSNERAFIRQALMTSGIRLDGRTPDDFRSISISINRSELSSVCETHLGTTSVIAIVTGEVVAPYPDRPTEGSLHFNTEISPQTELLGVTHSEISRLLERSIRDSETLDTESLCIVSGEKVWDIRCEMRIVDASGGNIIDACVLAAMGALRGFRKPDISVLSTSVTANDSVSKLVIHHSDEREPLPLALHHTPLSVTLGIMKRDFSNSAESESGFTNEQYIFVVDPSSQESGALDGSISFSMNAHRELCAVSKPGGVSLPVDSIMSAANICLKKVQYLHQRLTEALAVLDEEVNVRRAERQETLRRYNALVSAQKASKRGDEMDVEDMEDDDDDEAENVGGIDRDDPILQWSNLHKPVATRK